MLIKWALFITIADAIATLQVHIDDVYDYDNCYNSSNTAARIPATTMNGWRVSSV